jgi:hypothetical protein
MHTWVPPKAHPQDIAGGVPMAADDFSHMIWQQLHHEDKKVEQRRLQLKRLGAAHQGQQDQVGKQELC